MEIFMALFTLGGLLMIVDAYLPTLRIILQGICSVLLGVVIAAYILATLGRKNEEVDK